MSKIQEMHYKETAPLSTVDKLKGILSSMGIECEEEWQSESSIGTWALRVTFKGTSLGANGKGTTREFALASAYAELFERYQNDLLGAAYSLDKKSSYSFDSSIDEKVMTPEELISQENNAYFDMYFKERNLQDASLEEKVEAFKKVQKVDLYMRGDDTSYLTVPFYSVKHKKLMYLPKNVYRLSYGSNGMSAGNTFEEAVVQGISEIIERYVQRKIFFEKPTFPDIPESCIAKFPYVYEMYKKLVQNKNYKYLLKDCSVGGKYPVAALIIVDKRTGKYGVKLGCHPDFGVAIERTFTEAAQGQDILEYSGRSQVDFYNIDVDNEMNMYNTYKVGKGQFPYQIFGVDNTYEFKEVKDVSNLSNAQIMLEWCQEILGDGYDILIRDVSYLGFPSVHIIIPGLSEMFDADDSRYRTYNTRHFVSGLIMKPELINTKTSKYLIATLEYFLTSILENSIETYYSWYEKGEPLPCSKSGLGCVYMIAMCHILNGDYHKAAVRLKSMLNVLNTPEYDEFVTKDELTLYQVMYYYCSGMEVMNDKGKVISYLKNFMEPLVCDRVNELLGEEKDVIIKQYPSYEAYSKQYEDAFSKADNYFILREKLKGAQQNNPIDQMSIGQYFN